MRFAATLPPDGAAFEHDRDDQGRVLVWLELAHGRPADCAARQR